MGLKQPSLSSVTHWISVSAVFPFLGTQLLLLLLLSLLQQTRIIPIVFTSYRWAQGYYIVLQ